MNRSGTVIGSTSSGEAIKKCVAIVVWCIMLILVFAWCMVKEAFNRKLRGIRRLPMPLVDALGLR
jgi:hypothetical protein